MIDSSLFKLRGIKRVLALLAGLAVCESCAIFVLAWALSRTITNLWQGGALPDQVPWILLFAACFLSIQLIRYLQDLLLDRYAASQADTLRQQLIRTVFSVGSDVAQKRGTGTITTLLLEGIEEVEVYLHLILQKMMRLFVVPLLLLIPVFTLDWVSGIIMTLVFPFIVFYMVLLGRVAGERAARQHKVFQQLSNHFVDTLRGIDTLKFFGVSKKQGRGIYQVSERFRKATIKTLSVATLSSTALDLLATFSLAAVAIMLGLRLLDGSLVLFPALMILLLAPEYFKPLREFAADFHASLNGRNALNLLHEIIAESEDGGKIDSSVPLISESLASTSASLPPLTWSSDAELTIRGLGSFYDDFEALRDISFKVSGFMKVGIIGISGAGKSTLIRQLAGFSEPSGVAGDTPKQMEALSASHAKTTAESSCFVLNGTGLSSLRNPSWQKQVAYLPQDPYIFHATLRENIAFYHPTANDDEVRRAVEMVGLKSLVDELPRGLDTKIGEGARALSGGQAQRVALARVCLDPQRSILLFDEPTAHLDIETERELKERMLPLMENKLVFFATHRLHWMHNMDLILVMEDGRIVEHGSFKELQERNSLFANLVSQLRGAAT